MSRCLFLLAILFLAYPPAAAQARDITPAGNIDTVRELYNKVRETLPSEVNAQENTEAIRSRLQCYEEKIEYSQRIQICNNAYAKTIVSLARKEIHSRPSLGEFVINVGMCPILFNICMGQTGHDKERCILFERQCIDYTLDIFWRGSARYTQQTYRLDR